MLMEKGLQHIILHNVYLSFGVVQFYYLKTNAENAIQKTYRTEDILSVFIHLHNQTNINLT